LILLMEALAGGVPEVGQATTPPVERCPARFRAVRDEYLAACRRRGNAEASVVTKQRAAEQFLAYLEEVGRETLEEVQVRDLAGFWARRQRRGYAPKTTGLLRSALADFLRHLREDGQIREDLAGRLPPQRYPRRGQSAPHPWTAGEVRLVLEQIDRQSAIGKRDYAMVLLTVRLGVRVGDLRLLELGWFDWRAKTLALTQHKTGVALTLPLPGDVGWAVIDYIRHGRPEAACRQVFVKHRYPFTAFGSSASAGCRLSYYARRAGIVFAAGRSHGLHSLRGALAVAMLQSDTPPPVVTAVLGHAAGTTTAAAHYLRLDTEHLRRCALDVEDVLHAEQGARS
jgi:integrase